jgi:hypothetical protein
LFQTGKASSEVYKILRIAFGEGASSKPETYG